MTDEKSYYLFESSEAGLVGAREMDPEFVKVIATRFGSNINYRKVSKETYKRAKEELRDKESSRLVQSLRQSIRVDVRAV